MAGVKITDIFTHMESDKSSLSEKEAGWFGRFRNRISSEILKWGEFVKFSHTLFAMPFAIAAMALAARENRGWPGWKTFLLILICMTLARTAAMAFNRIMDRKYDAINPRTQNRHIPAGEISLASAWILCLLAASGFVIAPYWINPICFYLSPVALFLVGFYSLTKRFTDYTHYFLGIALAVAPVGAWLAVTGSFAISPILLAVIVTLWLVGLDIIYALQDETFDREHGLRSLPVRFGTQNALAYAFLVHMIMWGIMVIFGFLNGFRVAYSVGLVLILILLVLEHWLARKRSLKWIQVAFFRLNVLISLVYMVVSVAEVVFPGFRKPN